MKLFCDRRSILPNELITLLSGGNFKVDDIVLLIQCGIEAAKGSVPDEQTVCGWIDDFGFFASSGPLVDYANYIVTQMTVNVTPLPGDTDIAEEGEKKN